MLKTGSLGDDNLVKGFTKVVVKSEMCLRMIFLTPGWTVHWGTKLEAGGRGGWGEDWNHPVKEGEAWTRSEPVGWRTGPLNN